MNKDKKFFPVSLVEAGVLGLDDKIEHDMKNKSKLNYLFFRLAKVLTRVNFLHLVLFFTLISFIAYTKFVGIDWGLPYPMHPDERNMAVAITKMTCEFPSLPPISFNPWGYLQQLQISLKDCYNPHFYAYGQPPLFLGLLFAKMFFVTNTTLGNVEFVSAVLGLRLLSAISGILALFFSWKVLQFLLPKKQMFSKLNQYSYLLILGITPYAIQFSHFGTTETFLMACYLSTIYFTLLISKQKSYLGIRFFAIYLLSALVVAFALATKLSALMFIPVILLGIILHLRQSNHFWATKIFVIFGLMIMYMSFVLVFSLVFSPHNYFSMPDFISSMNYEAAVGTGAARVFYTRQFEHSLAGIFQFFRVFPYVLGLPAFILAIIGFFSIRGKLQNWIVFIGMIFVLLPSVLLYAKWSRFLAPIYPIMSIFTILGFEKLLTVLQDKINFKHLYPLVKIALLALIIVPGIAYLRIYQTPDVRFVASKWMFDNFVEGDIILSETANVVDTPIGSALTGKQAHPKIEYISFPSYDVDQSVDLQNKFVTYQQTADYILIPSRRVVANHTCIDWVQSKTGNVMQSKVLGYSSERCAYYQAKYPVLISYYEKLLGGELGFEKVAEFRSDPGISIYGKEIYKIDDEKAEESWTVFDHPVIRVYKRK